MPRMEATGEHSDLKGKKEKKERDCTACEISLLDNPPL